MRVNVKLTDAATKTIAKHKALGSRITTALIAGLNESLIQTQRYIQKEELSGQLLGVRTGALRRSIRATEPTRGSGGISGSVGPADDTVARYAAIHEFGGTIRPKKGKYLAIPLPAARTVSGAIMGKYNVSDLGTLDLTVIRSKAGNLLLVKKTKGRGKGKSQIVPLFVLKREVHIRAKHYMRNAADWMRPRIIPWVREKVNEALTG